MKMRICLAIREWRIAGTDVCSWSPSHTTQTFCTRPAGKTNNQIRKYVSNLCNCLISSFPLVPPVTRYSPEIKTSATSSFNLTSFDRSFPLIEYLQRARFDSCLQNTTMFPYSDRARLVTWQGLSCEQVAVPMGLRVITYSPFRAV